MSNPGFDALFEMEEFVRDTVELVRAAEMAAHAIEDDDQRMALRAVLSRAGDLAYDVRMRWREALQLCRDKSERPAVQP